MHSEIGTSGGNNQQPRWGQMQHQFCRPEELSTLIPVPTPEETQAAGWPGDPPSVVFETVTDDLAGGGPIAAV